MTKQDRVTVNDPRGPVNNGAGHQFVYYGAAADWMIRRGVEPLRITHEDRTRLADRFVPPAHYRAAVERLEKPGSVVLLEGPPGSGRRAAAIMMLHRLGEGERDDEEGIRFEELPATPPDKDDVPRAPSERDRFLVDLSRITDEDVYAQAQHHLVIRRSQVLNAGAHMVVVLPSGMKHAHDPDLEPHRVTLGRPHGIAVVTRHLRMERITFRAVDLAGTDLQRLYDRAPMRELARLARLVRTAREGGRFGADFAGWLDQAVHAMTDRAGEVSRQMTTVRTVPRRALLLATAMFEEAHADTVYEAWHSLMRTIGHKEETTSELESTDFGEQLVALDVERDLDGRLRFARLAYADAVRTYFWTNFPGLRDSFKDWIGHAAGLRGLTSDDRMNVVIRFGERSLAVGRPHHLFDLAVRWADGTAGASCAQQAVAALQFGLSHETFGGWFRRRIYECVRSGSLSDGLVRVLISTCLHSLGRSHPDQALVRLHHLAVRKGEAAEEARTALLDLASHDPRLYRMLIHRLRDRVRPGPRETDPHLRLLTELLASDRAPDPPPWPDLSLGWKTVLSHPPTEHWNPLVTGWLNATAEDSTRETALDMMVRAARGRRTALNRLYAIACDWAVTARQPSKAIVAALFWQHIDQAQCAHRETAERAGTGPRTMEEERA